MRNKTRSSSKAGQPPISFRALKLTMAQITDAIIAFYALNKGAIPTPASGDASQYFGLPAESATWRQVNGRANRMKRAGLWTEPTAETLRKAAEARKAVERQREQEGRGR